MTVNMIFSSAISSTVKVTTNIQNVICTLLLLFFVTAERVGIRSCITRAAVPSQPSPARLLGNVHQRNAEYR